MKIRVTLALLIALSLTACSGKSGPVASQPTTTPAAGSMAGMEMGGHNGMDQHDMQPGPHMRMTTQRTPTAADRQKLAQLEQTARASLSQYMDYKVAERDGYEAFFPNVPQEIYHFVNYTRSYWENYRLDPTQPGALLYKKVGDGYELVGVMYTAAITASEEQMNERVPLSLAPWHAHVNICIPAVKDWAKWDNARFGVEGSIASEADCKAANGYFLDHFGGWMVHIYPFAKS